MLQGRQCKQTLSSGCALKLCLFTAINPWPYAIINVIVLSYLKVALMILIITVCIPEDKLPGVLVFHLIDREHFY